MPTDPDPPAPYAALLAAFEAAGSLDIAALCVQFAQIQGRTVRLVAHRMPPGTFTGLWIATEDADFVVYDDALHPLAQYRSVVHTLGHLACGADAGCDLLPGLLARLRESARLAPEPATSAATPPVRAAAPARGAHLQRAAGGSARPPMTRGRLSGAL